MPTPLAGHTNSYHTYSFDEALGGIAEAGYRGVELSAVPGWTDHVDLDASPEVVRAKLGEHGLDPRLCRCVTALVAGERQQTDPKQRARPHSRQSTQETNALRLIGSSAHSA